MFAGFVFSCDGYFTMQTAERRMKLPHFPDNFTIKYVSLILFVIFVSFINYSTGQFKFYIHIYVFLLCKERMRGVKEKNRLKLLLYVP